ncbi:hypothetical protein JHW43_004960 [Diplocarpon mali]|nr:hypothetical protein JHW43_004960 [Diplocarpon mali]
MCRAECAEQRCEVMLDGSEAEAVCAGTARDGGGSLDRTDKTIVLLLLLLCCSAALFWKTAFEMWGAGDAGSLRLQRVDRLVWVYTGTLHRREAVPG